VTRINWFLLVDALAVLNLFMINATENGLKNNFSQKAENKSYRWSIKEFNANFVSPAYVSPSNISANALNWINLLLNTIKIESYSIY